MAEIFQNKRLAAHSIKPYYSALIGMFAFLYLSIVHAEPAFQFHTLDKQQGLASSVVYDIAQDGDGFIWFATEDGLQKYDGFDFTDYRHSRLDDHSISSNIVRSLLVDSKDQLWIGTNNGLNIYTKTQNKFRKIDKVLGSEVRMTQQVLDIFETKNKEVWVGTSKGLNRILNNNIIANYPIGKVRSILEDDNNNLWVGTLDSGLYLFDVNRNTFKSISVKNYNYSKH
ncbi:MAG: two-component regulator propeller domain-containing protein [Enterobacterales bacterium]|nr:two-component regulator propeller domain-containing protein [Enterobacterales bacterium]